MNNRIRKTLQNCRSRFEIDPTNMTAFEAVQKIFIAYPKNIDKHEVAWKVAVLNEFYRTKVYHKYKVIAHIQALAKGDLDRLLSKGEPSAVDEIRRGHKSPTKTRESNLYVFATKYCHFSNPYKYPIFDKYANLALIDLRDKGVVDFNPVDALADIEELTKQIDQIRTELGGWTYQEVDRALYMHGQDIEEKRRKARLATSS